MRHENTDESKNQTAFYPHIGVHCCICNNFIGADALDLCSCGAVRIDLCIIHGIRDSSVLL